MIPKIAPDAPTVGEWRIEQDRPGRAGNARGHVDHQEAARAERLLDGDAEDVEDEHVQSDVEHARMEECRGDDAPPLVVRKSLPRQGAVTHEEGASVVEAVEVFEGLGVPGSFKYFGPPALMTVAMKTSTLIAIRVSVAGASCPRIRRWAVRSVRVGLVATAPRFA